MHAKGGAGPPLDDPPARAARGEGLSMSGVERTVWNGQSAPGVCDMEGETGLALYQGTASAVPQHIDSQRL